MTISFEWIDVFATIGMIVLGIVIGWIVMNLTATFDFSLDLWWTYEVLPAVGLVIIAAFTIAVPILGWMYVL